MPRSLALFSSSDTYTQIAGWSEDPAALSIGIPQPAHDLAWTCSVSRVAAVQVCTALYTVYRATQSYGIGCQQQHTSCHARLRV